MLRFEEPFQLVEVLLHAGIVVPGHVHGLVMDPDPKRVDDTIFAKTCYEYPLVI